MNAASDRTACPVALASDADSLIYFTRASSSAAKVTYLVVVGVFFNRIAYKYQEKESSLYGG